MDVDPLDLDSWLSARDYLEDLGVAVREAVLERDRAGVVMRQATPARHTRRISRENDTGTPRDSRWGSSSLALARHARASTDYHASVEELVRIAWWYAAAAETSLRAVLDGRRIIVPDGLTEQALRSVFDTLGGEPGNWNAGIGMMVFESPVTCSEEARRIQSMRRELFTGEAPSGEERAHRYAIWAGALAKEISSKIGSSFTGDSNTIMWIDE